jgi:hypothetical protein
MEAAAVEATAATVEATAATVETTAAVEATAAAVKATATTAPGICRDRQDHRASQHGSACGEFRPECEHGCHHGTSSHATKVPHRLPTRARYFNPTRDKLFQFCRRRFLPCRQRRRRLAKSG